MQRIPLSRAVSRLSGNTGNTLSRSVISLVSRHSLAASTPVIFGHRTAARAYSSSADGSSSKSKSFSASSFLWSGSCLALGAYLSDKYRQSNFKRDQAAADEAGSTEELQDPITKRLNTESSVHRGDDRSPVAAYHVTRLEASSPCEDRYVHGMLDGAGRQGVQSVLEKPWHAWAVFDGHAGSQTAALLTKRLLPAVQDALQPLDNKGNNDEVVAAAIKKAFVALDDDIVKGAIDAVKNVIPYHEQVAKLMPAYTGSCALLSLFDPKTWKLRVACVGDSRAVLGQRNDAGEWEATALSVDQTGSNEEETARINAEHPGEDNIVKGGRVLGLMVSRGFGDGRWKWDLDFQSEIKSKFELGFSPLSPAKYTVKTPPYLTAEPVVTTTQLDRKRSTFLIMGSDGFWDRVSTEQAVDLVGRWLDFHGAELRSPLGRNGAMAVPTTQWTVVY
ncbi:phosphatase 2C-domain-containing protein, partial [Pestalotiopsis sp. NC0098]